MVVGGALEPQRRAQPQGCGGQSGEIPAQRRDSCTEDQCRPALSSLRGLSTLPLGLAGAES